jgi:hypothetical protein
MKFIETDLAYLAGIVDGEGYFAPKIGSNTFGLKVRVTDKILIEHLHKTFGGRVYYDHDRTKVNKPVHEWIITKMDELKIILKGIIPYLTIKKTQALTMLFLIEHIESRPRWTKRTYDRFEMLSRKVEVELWRVQRELLRLKVKEARLAGYYGS